MNRIFVDTSAWVALFDENDSKHHETVRRLDRIKRNKLGIVISDYVFSESITTALGRAGHRIAVTAGEYILESAIIKCVWLDEPLKLKAWEYFKRHEDIEYSFTDCTSFILMKEMKIRGYLAFDDHFRQAGFEEFS